MPYYVWCFLVGADSTFSVTVDETRIQVVDHLKDAIKEKIGYSERPLNLTLYRAAIQFCDRETRINELKRLSENWNECTKLDSEEELSKILGERLPPEMEYYILVQPPQSSK
jgi:hypothetical protein